MLTRKTVVRLADHLLEPKTGRKLVPSRRRGKWRPLGARYHVPGDPTLVKLAGSLRDGKHVLMELARRAGATDLVIARLVEKWDALSLGAQRAVTLTDLCKFADVEPRRFIAATARAGLEIDNASVIIALDCMKNVPADVELAVREELARLAAPHPPEHKLGSKLHNAYPTEK